MTTNNKAWGIFNLHDLACHLKLGTGRIRFAQNKKVVDKVDITKPFVPMFSAWNGYYPNGQLRFTYRQSIPEQCLAVSSTITQHLEVIYLCRK